MHKSYDVDKEVVAVKDEKGTIVQKPKYQEIVSVLKLENELEEIEKWIEEKQECIYRNNQRLHSLFRNVLKSISVYFSFSFSLVVGLLMLLGQMINPLEILLLLCAFISLIGNIYIESKLEINHKHLTTSIGFLTELKHKKTIELEHLKFAINPSLEEKKGVSVKTDSLKKLKEFLEQYPEIIEKILTDGQSATNMGEIAQTIREYVDVMEEVATVGKQKTLSR